MKKFIVTPTKNRATLSLSKSASTLARIEVDGAANKTMITYTLSDGNYRKVNATARELENGIYIVVTNHATRKIRK